MKRIISRDRSVIPACDVDLPVFEKILQTTAAIEQVGAYKIGAALALSESLPKVVALARKYTRKPIIYDHQKAGTDIPDTALSFASTLKKSGIDAVILFPLAGPKTQRAWIHAAQDVDIPVIVGSQMTHEAFLKSEGGYIDDSAVEHILLLAGDAGVSNFVVPGNQPSFIASIRKLLIGKGIEPVFYAPGFITQGGDVTAAASAAGPKWHAIVGRAIYGAANMELATRSLAAAI
jgi:orotidine-5'-phosphate decarboxylase